MSRAPSNRQQQRQAARDKVVLAATQRFSRGEDLDGGYSVPAKRQRLGSGIRADLGKVQSVKAWYFAVGGSGQLGKRQRITSESDVILNAGTAMAQRAAPERVVTKNLDGTVFAGRPGGPRRSLRRGPPHELSAATAAGCSANSPNSMMSIIEIVMLVVLVLVVLVVRVVLLLELLLALVLLLLLLLALLAGDASDDSPIGPIPCSQRSVLFC